MNLDKVNKYIKDFEKTIKKPKTNFDKSKFYVGVDLGTANIVITILDKDGKPVAGATQRSRVVRDGIVVDFMGAIGIVRKLKEDLEEKLGIQITEGYTAIPPGVEQGSVKAIVNVIESAGIDVLKVVDEPTAASYVLGIADGVVVDLGGGTTGISILEKGKVVFVADEPTGGTHMTLVLAGSYGVDFETAEDIKTDKKKEKEVFVQITPVLQKMASIVKKYIKDYKVKDVYLVGGACSFDGSESIFEKELGLNIYKPYMPVYITPLGIALAGMKE
ncbi:ethanolamine utilization protein EutJ [Fusobacterium polymorphum]|uniref:ethanolamine utilization protein EutJ n=1 Tax=Fusobacterium nucleatum subsp. polymorphum TaxID=76857 RepID=UPI001DE0098D|nr:ethanolamine utilization protein EutJ [Fusobacterium polymorphum]MBS5187741.1 ethanolamine utilization protein EutJ [Fusobacterium nucleatum]WRL75150.1 ethanolamine utilization protein EutJ [Fusobacterium polymorphum]BEO93110.1 ethanolamine utilization protein EutJ [Fusobacterium nucleatum]BEP02796.1 ethanolamine utilization protein EutJ [Fusobacterium nucleatum]